MQAQAPASLVIFGLSNILSDLFDCAIEGHLALGKVVIDQPEAPGARDRTIAQRLDALQGIVARPVIESLDDFTPAPGERYILGPTTPARAGLAARLRDHPAVSAYVVEAENFESIHNHSAYARIESPAA